MCRFIAYLGRPIPINNVIAKPQYSLVQQSQHEVPKAHFVWIEPECAPELFAI